MTAFTPPVIEDVRAEAGADYSRVRIVCRVSSAEGIRDYGILFGEGALRQIPASNLEDRVFSVEVEGLAYSRSYVYQAYIDGGQGPVFSKTQFWRTADETPPVPVILHAVRGYGAEAGHVTLTCHIRDLAGTVGKDRLHYGVCCAPAGTLPGLDDSFREADGYSEAGDYSVDFSGLVPSASYVFRPYTAIGEQVSYGEALPLRSPSAAEVVLTQGYSDLEGTLSSEVDASETLVYAFELNGTYHLASRIDEARRFFLTLDNLTPATDYSFRAVVKVGENTFYGETLSFRTDPFPETEQDYVDLGLGVLWATCNLGAGKPTEKGNTYAWGETAGIAINGVWERRKPSRNTP